MPAFCTTVRAGRSPWRRRFVRGFTRVILSLALRACPSVPRGRRHFLPSHTYESLRNGDLVEAAAQGGFSCIITQDVEFQKSASKNLKRFPQMSLVLVRIRQQKGRGFLSQFEEAGNENR